MVENLDTNIGKLVATLETEGLLEDTLIVFTSDNGGLATAEGSPTCNAPLAEGKGWMYEGGTREPLIAHCPGLVPAGTISNVVTSTPDFYPTFLELAGAAPSEPGELDATSLVPILEGGTIDAPRDLYFVRREGGRAYGGKSYEALIRGEWKLMQNDPYSPLELYNLNNDPGETTNLASKAPKVFNELSAALATQIQRGGAVPWQKP